MLPCGIVCTQKHYSDYASGDKSSQTGLELLDRNCRICIALPLVLQHASGRLFRQIGDHGFRRRFDRVLPAGFAEFRRIRFFAEGEVDASGTVDDRAQTLAVERAGDIARAAALGSVAGDEQRDVGHPFSEGGEFFGIGRADDRSRDAVTALAQSFFRELFEFIGDRFVKCSAISGAILERGGAGVAGSHKDIDARSPFFGDVQEGLQRIDSEVGVHGEGIGGEDGAIDIGAGKIGLRVCFGGGADVAALGVADDEQIFGASVADHLLQGFDTSGTEAFEESGLRFHDGHERSDDIDDFAAEAANRFRFGATVGPKLQRLGEQFEAGIEADEGGGFLLANGGVQTVGEVRHFVDLCERGQLVGWTIESWKLP